MKSNSVVRIAGITKESVCDGPGIRFVIFTQGCFHCCEGCHNPQTHDPNGGYEISIAELLAMVDENPLLDGVTLSGGEPFLQAGVLSEFAKECHDRGLSVMVYTGYLYEEIVAKADKIDWQKLLDLTEILVDGRFVREQATQEIPFIGSTNQRVLNLILLRCPTQTAFL
ncbi:MAG: anaerobic ribonucleoside-triphosphate reductase activating protein [Planctomycetaceae bacterium]|jgi:anaerobic ribonucleoside-triphosphate reductase activating protein|nr:anaerobic ribonucleoside-triphosphate reductase activating protein [Planctomycetaceae bacterium]